MSTKLRFVHPELRPGEVLLTNCRSQSGDYEDIGRKTKRMGVRAYDRNGEVIPGYFPVFVLKKDLASLKSK